MRDSMGTKDQIILKVLRRELMRSLQKNQIQLQIKAVKVICTSLIFLETNRIFQAVILCVLLAIGDPPLLKSMQRTNAKPATRRLKSIRKTRRTFMRSTKWSSQLVARTFNSLILLLPLWVTTTTINHHQLEIIPTDLTAKGLIQLP